MEFVKSLSILANFLSPSRIRKFSSNLKNRTDFITIVVDDIYQGHNASAVLRSCDAFGLVELYVVEGKNKFSPVKGISQSAEKWLEIKRFTNQRDCYNELKRNGYKICVAIPPSEKSVYIDEFSFDEKIAVIVGSEMEGVSDFFKERADIFLSIRMYGFVQSFNLSVASALILYELRRKLHISDIDWHLPPLKKASLFYKWMKKSVYFSDKLDIVKKSL